MRLWSTLVIHSRHRYGHQPFTVTSPSTATMTMRTTAMLMRGSGSLNGIASQLSFPSMSTSGLTRWWTPCVPDSRVSGAGRLLQDALKQLRVYRAIGCGRYGLARFCQFGIASIIERRSDAARLLNPSIEIASGYRFGDESHLRKPVAAEHCRKAGIFARAVGEKVKMRDHAAHGVDLTAELRHEERVHHCGRGQPKFDG